MWISLTTTTLVLLTTPTNPPATQAPACERPCTCQVSVIKGTYVESRDADVYTGPCFSNAEAFISGHRAVMAWKIGEGTWNGVDLSGMIVGAALLGTETFPHDDHAGGKSVILVDRHATASQREALVAFARHMAQGRLDNVVEVRSTLMTLNLERPEEMVGHDPAHDDAGSHGMPQAPMSAFWAAGEAEILARPLGHCDHLCGNEEVAYDPLSRDVEVQPAFTLRYAFKGKGLNETWSSPDCRGTFAGHFTTSTPTAEIAASR
jgi:hypothetical protein